MNDLTNAIEWLKDKAYDAETDPEDPVRLPHERVVLNEIKRLRARLAEAEREIRSYGDAYPGSDCQAWCHQVADRLAGKTDQPTVCPDCGVVIPQAPDHPAHGVPCPIAGCTTVKGAVQPSADLAKFAADLVAAQRPLDPLAEKVLYENLPDLYIDGGTPDKGAVQPSAALTGVEFLLAWMGAKNPQFGGMSPLELIDMGRADKLATFIRSRTSDWCYLCDAPQWVMPDGEHKCGERK